MAPLSSSNPHDEHQIRLKQIADTCRHLEQMIEDLQSLPLTTQPRQQDMVRAQHSRLLAWSRTLIHLTFATVRLHEHGSTHSKR